VPAWCAWRRLPERSPSPPDPSLRDRDADQRDSDRGVEQRDHAQAGADDENDDENRERKSYVHQQVAATQLEVSLALTGLHPADVRVRTAVELGGALQIGC
jgi:hypothetical protein